MRFLAWWLLLAGCNQIYGLDDTKIRPQEAGLPADLDRDGVPDESDRCPGVADPAQEDRDGDGFGDACDACPTIQTAVNHDEDGDSYGDECDLCPNDPDFQIDGGDMDGVGSLCDNDAATRNTLLLFDPFITIRPEYEQTGTWSVSNDTISGETGSTLTTTTVTLTGAKPFVIALGISLTEPLIAGSNGFRLDLVDDGGVALGCSVACPGTGCGLRQDPSMGTDFVTGTPPLPTLYLRRTPTLDACVFESAVASSTEGIPPPVFGLVRIRIVGAPNVRFRFLTVWQ